MLASLLRIILLTATLKILERGLDKGPIIDVDRPENAGKYPEKIRKSKALMAIYDNVGENEKLALEIHQTVLDNKMANFRDNPVVVRRIKKELAKLLNYIKEDRIYEEVERIYKVIEMQEEY